MPGQAEPLLKHAEVRAPIGIGDDNFAVQKRASREVVASCDELGKGGPQVFHVSAEQVH
jgi:hypothetical protein